MDLQLLRDPQNVGLKLASKKQVPVDINFGKTCTAITTSASGLGISREWLLPNFGIYEQRFRETLLFPTLHRRHSHAVATS